MSAGTGDPGVQLPGFAKAGTASDAVTSVRAPNLSTLLLAVISSTALSFFIIFSTLIDVDSGI
jgi:hypothetical protein